MSESIVRSDHAPLVGELHAEERARITEGRGVGEMRSACKCGAMWTHPISRPTEEMDAIFRSHVNYFENRTLVL